MSACEPLVFNGVSQEKWDCIKQTVQQKTGILIETDSGSTTRMSFTVTWNCDLAAQTLTFQVTDKPVMIPCETIYSRFREVVNGCSGIEPDPE